MAEGLELQSHIMKQIASDGAVTTRFAHRTGQGLGPLGLYSLCGAGRPYATGVLLYAFLRKFLR